MKILVRIVSFAIMLSAASCSCSPEEIGMQYSAIQDSDYSPEGIYGWQAYSFVFDDGICIDSKKAPTLSALQTLNAKEGNSISIVATESSDNIGFTCLTSGKRSEEYQIYTEDLTSLAPRIWSETSVIESSEGKVTQVLKPMTADISIRIENAPAAFKSVTLSIPDGTNTWNIVSNIFECTGNPFTTALTSDISGKDVTIFPPLRKEGEWQPDIRVIVGDESITPVMNLSERIVSGTSATLTLDFADYVRKGTFELSYSSKDVMNPYGKAYTETVTVATSAAASKGENTHYKVLTEGIDGYWSTATVHDALCSDARKHSSIWNDWSNSRALRDTMSYCIVESEFPAKIRVRKYGDSFSSVQVRPSTYGIEVTDLGNNMIEFTLPSEAQGKVSVEFDDDRYHNLFIYAYEPDENKPSRSDPNVIYYGPGVYSPGTIKLNEGQTLYIDYGAKVYANVVTRGNNVTIAGHGILSGEKMKHFGDNLYSWGDFLMNCGSNASNLTIKDITMIDSPGWNMIVTKMDGVVIDGINMISWELNGDGIDLVSSRNVEISNCFLRTYDDAITLKCRFIAKPITDVYNVKIHDCLIWADYARGIVIGPEAGNTDEAGYIHDVEVYDCIFLHHKRSLNDDLRSAFAIGQGSDGSDDLWSGSVVPNKMTGIYAHDLIFDNIDKSGRAAAIWQYGTGTDKVNMSDIRLENFRVIDNVGNNYPALTIKTKGSTINNMKVSNFTVNGEKITLDSPSVSIDYPDNVDITIE